MNSPSDREKVLFHLSLSSNLVSGQRGENLEEKLYHAIQDKLQEYQEQLGRWEVVWGPAVVQPVKNGYVINAMYVAHSLDTPSWYVVSIAGTNPSSLFDWLFEDLLVKYQVPWVFGTEPNAKIALGTAIGLDIILAAKPGGDRPNAGKILIEFLKDLPEKDIGLCVTGHSLGGALSPTLALLLKNIQLRWDSECKAKISAMSTAGPTAGNSAFSQYSDGILKEVTRYWNSLDVVPHAWNETTLEQIKRIYVPSIPKNKGVNLLVNWAEKAALNGDYYQIKPNELPFEGEINQEIIDPKSPAFINFFRQVGYQHVEAYMKYFAIPGIVISYLAELCRDPKTIFTPALQRFAKRIGISLPSELIQDMLPPGPVTIPIAGQLIALPTDTTCPRMLDIVEPVTAELKRYISPC